MAHDDTDYNWLTTIQNIMAYGDKEYNGSQRKRIYMAHDDK